MCAEHLERGAPQAKGTRTAVVATRVTAAPVVGRAGVAAAVTVPVARRVARYVDAEHARGAALELTSVNVRVVRDEPPGDRSREQSENENGLHGTLRGRSSTDGLDRKKKIRIPQSKFFCHAAPRRGGWTHTRSLARISGHISGCCGSIPGVSDHDTPRPRVRGRDGRAGFTHSSRARASEAEPSKAGGRRVAV